MSDMFWNQKMIDHIIPHIGRDHKNMHEHSNETPAQKKERYSLAVKDFCEIHLPFQNEQKPRTKREYIFGLFRKSPLRESNRRG